VNSVSLTAPSLKQKRSRAGGFTLVETVLGLLLMGAIMMPLMVTGAKTRAQVIKEGANRRINHEVTQVLRNLSEDIRNAHTLFLASPVSSANLLGLDRFNPYGGTFNGGSFIQTQWRLSSGVLEFSADGGTTWRSPYPVSAANAYSVTGNFSYCTEANVCSASPSSSSRKIRLNGWVFTHNSTGQRFDVPETYLNMPTRAVANTTTTISSFSTNSGTFPSSGFTVADLTYHPATKQLVVVGGTNQIYRVNPEGILIGTVLTVPSTEASAPTISSIDLEPDGAFAWIIDTANSRIKRINMTDGTVSTPNYTFTSQGFINMRGIAYEEGDTSSPIRPIRFVSSTSAVPTATYITMSRADGTGVANWSTANISTSAYVPLVGTAGGVALDTISSDGEMFIIGQTVTSGNVTVYRYNPAHTGYSTGSNYSFTLNLGQMGSSDTSTNRNFGLAFDPTNNRLFVADPSDSQKRVFQVLPPRTLTRPL
jgi:type II secretory pathway pseudopilin PulG